MRKTWYVMAAVLLVLGLAVFFVPQDSIDAAPSTSPVGGGSSDTYSSGGIYLKLDGIKGESGDKSHPDEMELLSFQQGVSRSAGPGVGGGGGAGKANIKDIVITKRIDKASPRLYEAVVKGTHIKDGYIAFVKSGQKPEVYYKIKLTDIIVTSFTQSDTNEANTLPVEEITLNFGKIELIYKETKPDGTLGAETKTTYDVKLGK